MTKAFNINKAVNVQGPLALLIRLHGEFLIMIIKGKPLVLKLSHAVVSSHILIIIDNTQSII